MRYTTINSLGENVIELKKGNEENWSVSQMADGITTRVHSEAIDKLAELEDLMEENEWDSIEDMKSTLKKCEDKYFKMHRDYEELKHCIWKDTPIEQIRNNYERGHNFDFVGVAYNRGKAKVDRKVRRENETLKDRWQELKKYMQTEHDWGLENDYQDCSFAIRLILDKMQELEE